MDRDYFRGICEYAHFMESDEYTFIDKKTSLIYSYKEEYINIYGVINKELHQHLEKEFQELFTKEAKTKTIFYDNKCYVNITLTGPDIVISSYLFNFVNTVKEFFCEEKEDNSFKVKKYSFQ